MSKKDILFSDRIKNIFLYILFDIIVIDFSILAGVGLWYDGSIPGGIKTIISDQTWQWYIYVSIIAPIIKVAVYFLMKFYNKLWKYTTSEELIKVLIAETIIFIGVFCVDNYFLSGFKLMEH